MALRDRVAKYVPAVRKRTTLSRDQMMAVAPVHNSLITWNRVESGEIALSIPRRSDRLGRAIGRLFRVPDRKEILLDEVGSTVWEMCDGKHSIGNIIAEMSNTYKLNRREAEVSVTTYIKMLAERRLVGLLQRGGNPQHGRR